MNTFAIFSTQLLLTFISYGLLAAWYVYPALKKMPVKNAVMIMIFVNVFRQLGLSYLHAGLTGADPTSLFAIVTAYGDVAASILGIIALLSLRYNAPWSWPLVWIFNVVGLVDLLNADTFGIIDHVWNFLTSAGWFIPVFIVPALIISHIIIFLLLGRRKAA